LRVDHADPHTAPAPSQESRRPESNHHMAPVTQSDSFIVTNVLRAEFSGRAGARESVFRPIRPLRAAIDRPASRRRGPGVLLTAVRARAFARSRGSVRTQNA
jgi:hypothetical protein